MAQGDLVLFNEFREQVLLGEHDLNATDAVKVSLATNAVVPTASTVSPTFSDFTEVATGNGYTTKGATIGTPVVVQVSYRSLPINSLQRFLQGHFSGQHR